MPNVENLQNKQDLNRNLKDNLVENVPVHQPAKVRRIINIDINILLNSYIEIHSIHF